MADDRPATSGRYRHIDAMRAFAVMLVVVAHAGLGHVVPGGSGVTIFFAISGFIITHLLIRERDRSGTFRMAGFYRRRLLKIGPPFVVAVLLPSLVYGLFVRFDGAVLLTQVFFVYNWVRAFGGGEFLPGSNVVWSLAIEEQFYIVFAVVWLVLCLWSRRLAPVAVLAALVVVGSLAAKVWMSTTDPATDRIYYGTDTRVDGIALGVLAAVAFARWSRDATWLPGVRRVMASGCVVFGAALLYLVTLVVRADWFRDTVRYPLQAVAACVLILFGLLAGGGIVARGLRAVSAWAPVRTVGLASYSIYLAHAPVVLAVEPYIRPLPRPVAVVALLMLGTVAGVVLWRVVEVPLDPLRHRMSDNAEPAADVRENRDTESMVK